MGIIKNRFLLIIFIFIIFLTLFPIRGFPQDKGNPDKLIALLQDENPFVRKDAIVRLGYIRDEKAVSPLTQLLRKSDFLLGYYIKEALIRIGNPAVPQVNGLLKDSDPVVRLHAARILGHIKDESSIGFLVQTLKDTEKNVRLFSAEALGNFRSQKAVPGLIRLLKDKEVDVKKEAAIALGKIKDKKAVKPLISCLKDNDQFVQKFAIEALGKIADSEAVDALLKMLEEKHWRPRMWAAWALGEIGDKKALRPLTEAARDSDWRVRKYATIALKKVVLTKMLDKRIQDDMAKKIDYLSWPEIKRKLLNPYVIIGFCVCVIILDRFRQHRKRIKKYSAEHLDNMK